MKNLLQSIFQSQVQKDQNTRDDVHLILKRHDKDAKQLAEVLMLIEIALCDNEFSKEEEDLVRQILTRDYGLGKHQAETFLQDAVVHYENVTSHYAMTRLINDTFDYAEKLELLAKLWALAYADETLDPVEESTMRKFSDLLHIRHVDYIFHRNKVKGSITQPR